MIMFSRDGCQGLWKAFLGGNILHLKGEEEESKVSKVEGLRKEMLGTCSLEET